MKKGKEERKEKETEKERGQLAMMSVHPVVHNMHIYGATCVCCLQESIALGIPHVAWLRSIDDMKAKSNLVQRRRRRGRIRKSI